MRISDWSSDVCSSDLHVDVDRPAPDVHVALPGGILQFFAGGDLLGMLEQVAQDLELDGTEVDITTTAADPIGDQVHLEVGKVHDARPAPARSAERRVGKEGVSTCRARWSAYH